MPIPLIIWGALAVGGLLAANEVIDSTGETAEKSTKLVKWVVIGGGVYVSYKALKSAGVLK